MKYVDNDITFNDVGAIVFPMGTKISSSQYNIPDDEIFNDDYQININDIGGKYGFGAVNVINVDWNGAEVNGTTIKTTGQLLKKIADTEKDVETLKKFHDGIVTLPAKLLAFYSDSEYVGSNLDSVSGLKTFNTETSTFAINDDSVLNKFTVDRSETAQYSVFAYPKSFGGFQIPATYKVNVYNTEYDGQPYCAIVSISKSKAFAPIKVVR